MPIPRKGSHEYKLLWDTTSLPIAIDSSILQLSVFCNDKDNMVLLHVVHFMLDDEYLNGPEGILAIGQKMWKWAKTKLNNEIQINSLKTHSNC